MSARFSGGVISKTPPTVTGPTDGEGGSASGVWSLAEIVEYNKNGLWPKPILPRELYAWGQGNPSAVLGLNIVDNVSSPTQVGSLVNWSLATSSASHSLAIKTDGTLWSWGSGGNGRLGTNDIINRSSPTQIGSLTNWALSTASSSQSGAIKTDGTLWTWGWNILCNLGDGTNIDKSSPIQIGAQTNWAVIDAGSNFFLAVKTTGTLWGWGSNGSGQLGDSDPFTNKSSPVQIGALTNWADVSAAGSNSIATKTDGTLWTWGYGTNGVMGLGGCFIMSSPNQIGALTNWCQARAWSTHRLAVKTDGTLWSWGGNNQGQLGTYVIGCFLDDVSSPVQVGALTTWCQVDVGTAFSAAIKTDGTLWMWGSGICGRLGQNTTTSHSSPVQVGSLTTWCNVSIGSGHALAITKG